MGIMVWFKAFPANLEKGVSKYRLIKIIEETSLVEEMSSSTMDMSLWEIDIHPSQDDECTVSYKERFTGWKTSENNILKDDASSHGTKYGHIDIILGVKPCPPGSNIYLFSWSMLRSYTCCLKGHK